MMKLKELLVVMMTGQVLDLIEKMMQKMKMRTRRKMTMRKNSMAVLLPTLRPLLLKLMLMLSIFCDETRSTWTPQE